MRCDIILWFFFFWTQHDRFSSLIHGDLVCKHLCEERKLQVLFNNSFGFTCGTMASSAWVCSWDPSPIFNYLLLIRNWIFYLCRGKSWPEGRLSCQSSFFSVGLAVCIRPLFPLNVWSGTVDGTQGTGDSRLWFGLAGIFYRGMLPPELTATSVPWLSEQQTEGVYFSHSLVMISWHLRCLMTAEKWEKEPAGPVCRRRKE